MSHYGKLLFFVLIYLISNNKWILVESGDTSTTPKTGTEESGPETTPPTNLSELSPFTPPATTNKAKSSTNPSGGGTKSEHNFKEVDASNHPKEIKLFSADPNDNTKTVEIDSNKYKVKKDENNKDLFQYEFNDGVNCTLIKNDDKQVWKHDSSKHSGKYPKSFNYNIKDSKIILKCTDLFIVCEKEGDNYKDTEFNKKTPHELSLKATKDTDQFDYKKDGKIATFTAKDNYTFNSVKTGEKILWLTDDETEYAKQVILESKGKKEKFVTICKLNGNNMAYIKNGKNQQWCSFDLSKTNPEPININYPYETYFYKNQLKGNTRTFEAVDGFAFKLAYEYFNNNKVEIWKTTNENEFANKIEVDLMNNDSKAVTVYMAGNNTKVFKKDGKNEPWKEIDTSKVNPKSININYPYDSYFYKNQIKNKFRTFTAKTGFTFKGVVEYIDNNTLEIWNADLESEYVNKIEVDSLAKDGKAVTVFMGNDKTRIFIRTRAGKPWAEFDTSKVNPKPININYPHQSYFYKNVLKNKTRTFIAKNGFAFNCACDYVYGTKVVIWKTDNESEYADKVEYAKRYTGKHDVTIYSSDKKTKLFLKESSDHDWQQIDLTKVNPQSVNIDYEHESHFYTNKLSGNFRTFTSKKGFAFNCANEYTDNNKNEIWKTDNANEYANKIEVDIISVDCKAVIVYVDDKTRVFMKDSINQPWREIDTTKVNFRSVDINYPYETYFYKNELKANVRAFEAKAGFAFNAVLEFIDKNNGVKIWRADNESEQANKIVNEGGNKVTIHLASGSTKAFIKKSDRKWTEDTIQLR